MDNGQTAQSVFEILNPHQTLDSQNSAEFAVQLRQLADRVEGRFQPKLQREHASRLRRESQRSLKGGMDFGKYQLRYVALEVLYLGWRYHGFASQHQNDSVDTVEAALFSALKRTCLVPPTATWRSLSYSRCGRTDRGVSALGQGKAGMPMPEPQAELDYPTVLNRALPDDIYVLGWADVPLSFSARFSAQHREYKYHIVQDGSLDISAMQAAADHLPGEHDFRNFCKVDVGNVTNFRRMVLSCRLEPMAGCCYGASTIFVLHIIGTAFLWHQVRCIAAVLLMVGRGQEHPDVVRRMLDLSAVPRKPQYSMAAEARPA